MKISIGADAVHFGAASYQHLDQTLTRPAWGILPRAAIAFVVRCTVGPDTR